MDENLTHDDGVLDENVVPTEDDTIANPPPEDKARAYTELLILYNKLSRWNPTTLYDDATQLVVAAQQLLINYNEQCVEFINDTDDTSSLLLYLSTDGLEQWNLHKGFKERYNVSIY